MTPKTLNPTFPQHLIAGFRFGEGLLRKNLAGMSDPQGAARPAADHNNALWVAGHITYWRSQIVAMLGGEPVWAEGEAEVFKGMKRASPPATDGWTLRQVMSAYDQATERLYSALGTGAPPAEGGEQLVGGLGSLALHEAYHVGQLGTLRRLAGLAGVA